MMQSTVILAAVLASLIAAMSLAAPAKPENPRRRRRSRQAAGPCRRCWRHRAVSGDSAHALIRC